MKKFVFIFFLHIVNIGLAQDYITGVVMDSKTLQPIESATVYFDNTTIGTTTNKEGHFSIKLEKGISSSLIVSFLGYKVVTLTSYEPNIRYKIMLEEDTSILEEVVITTDNIWTREYMLKQFKDNFLGTSKSARRCYILNEEDIDLSFDLERNKLIAKSNKPLQIVNEYLGYQINYQLEEFYINYLKYKGREKPWYKTKSSYYAGTSFFTSIHSIATIKKIEKRRNEIYEGSVLHFMRAIFNNRVNEEGFKLYREDIVIKPGNENYLIVGKTDDPDFVYVKIIKPLTILYKNGRTSQVQIEDGFEHFFINTFGNHIPPNALYFSGDMGEQRFGDCVPLDYFPK